MNFLKTLQSTFTKRRLVLVFFLIIVFIIKERVIISFIENIFFLPEDFSNFYLDWLLVISSILTSCWFLYLIIRKNYKPSYLQTFLIFSTLILLVYFFSKSNILGWKYYTIPKTEFEYIYLLIIPLLFFLVTHCLRYIFTFKTEDQDIFSELQLVQDNPITNNKDEVLGYIPIVNKLYRILISQKSDKAITIGLIGPWGNGKSSIINMLMTQLKPDKSIRQKIISLFRKDELDDILIIHFLPYLNHKEDDLITEFFRELSSAIKPYNGKLSNLVMEYSKRLIEVYKNNINLNFFEKHITSFEKTSAKEMYDGINERLKETEKK